MNRRMRAGQITVFFVAILPLMLGIAGLMLDGGKLLVESRRLQDVCDAAATAAAAELQMTGDLSSARLVAENVIGSLNSMTLAVSSIASPPTSGEYTGDSHFVEVQLEQSVTTHLIHLLNVSHSNTVSSRSVAGFEPSNIDAALVVLDPSPDPFSILGLPVLLPPLHSLLGGLEALGVGPVMVDGAVQVNTQWSGEDEFGESVGVDGPLLTHSISCTPLLGLSHLHAPEIRSVGGVDDLALYHQLDGGGKSPLQANRLPVPDPLRDLPVPTVAIDPTNVSNVYRGTKNIVIALPLLTPPIVLSPGVYDWINIVTGRVTFEPGIYVIRGQHPVTGHGLLISGLANVDARGVMFYLTDSASYSASSGMPDASDSSTNPPPSVLASQIPSAIITLGLLGTRISPLNSPGSPFDGMTIFQRRHDRRPIVLVQEDLLGGGYLEGRVYAKWGHTLIAGKGDIDAAFVSGTMRVVNLLGLRISPSAPFPPANDVYLVE
ncbi:Tad domain-containing protein [Aureliella helgolandensis]|uniref:Putative Flp pilus-assembly TadG-like N-terminal domain-containing protein n=1 Tax=Aureliella helgolandensis TaxID=2527968 RepID=A0A518G3X2_9BACT|nr:Tad domain-containing protein [Aureliella helgolandensis]QDV23298.1 hypothetical protein Q31a_15960 [Aureliella helgolandensis]